MALGYSQGAGAYQQVRTQGGVETADPHGLITMLMDGALERMRFARGCIAHPARVRILQVLREGEQTVGALQAALNHEVGTPLVAQLEGLYDYMTRRLLHANLHNDSDALDEVGRLLGQIRDSWAAIPVEARQLAGAGA